MADDLGERTEQATPKRRQEARAEGQVARSHDFSSALLLLVATVAIAAGAMWMLGEAKLLVAALLDGAALVDPLDPHSARDGAFIVGAFAVRLATPFMLVAWAAAFLATFGQIGFVFAPKMVAPSFSKIDPLRGFRRIFGVSGLMKAILDSLKILIVGVVVVVTVRQRLDEIVVLPYLVPMESLARGSAMLLELALRILAVLLLLGVIDLLWQRTKHARDMRMSRQQIKDEMKQTEGDPEVKRRRMRMQQQIAMQRLSAVVPKADVIVTNPEHVAVAIRYDPERMNAPRVIAKGADYLALRIRQLAMRHGIPVIERKPLARALYRAVAVGREIPPDFYSAVAEVLAYVYRLGGRRAG